MFAVLRVDELNVDPKAVAAALDAALEDITDVQLPANRFHVERLAFVGERRVARDDEGSSDAREIGRQALGDAVDEIFVLGIAADIGERQDDNREARGAGFSDAGDGAGFAWAGAPISSE